MIKKIVKSLFVFILSISSLLIGNFNNVFANETIERNYYENKVVSILGDSISTFDGYIPVDDGVNLEHATFYPNEEISKVEDTWWYKVIETLDAKLGVNDSWSGSTVYNNLDYNTEYVGKDASMASLTRIKNLGSNSIPDIILFFGGVNDIATKVPMGEFDEDNAPTTVDLTSYKWESFFDSYVCAILRIKHFYPNSQLVCIEPLRNKACYSDAQLIKYTDVLKRICSFYNVGYVSLFDQMPTSKLHDITHPSKEGMEIIASCVVDYLNNDITRDSLDKLFIKYRHNGVYTKKTNIYLNEDSLNEISSIFHAKNTLLERITYYNKDKLWMSNEFNMYSYYGTDNLGNLTNANVKYVGETSDNIAISGISMEEYYITMNDIIARTLDDWKKVDNVYQSSSLKVVDWFKNFTAPCYLGFDEKTDHYILFDRVEVEETTNGLELRLIADYQDYSKLTSEEGIFSRAIITYDHIDDNGRVIECASSYTSGLIEHTCLECGELYTKKLYPIGGKEVDVYPSLSNADTVTFQGNIYTYGGSHDGSKRTDSIYCFNTYNNKLYELDVKIQNAVTSLRVLLHDDKVYIFGGTYGVKYDTIQVHDLKNNTITTLEKKMPFGANCFQIGSYYDQMYIFGGVNSIDGSNNKIYKMDLNTFETSLLDVKLPTTIFKGGWITIGDYAYIIGGTSGPRLNTIHRFNMKTEKLETMNAKLPQLLSQCRLAYLNDKIYIVGGTIEGNSLIDNVYVYDINNDILTELEYSLPEVIANTCVGVVNNKLYVLAGNNDINNLILRLDETGFVNLME